jgi:hypothetical protein
MSVSRLLLPLVVATIGLASLACASAPSDWDSGGTCGSSDSGSYDFTFTCDVSGPYTVPVPIDGCEASSEYYAEVFGCNEMAQMYDACMSYASCYCEDTSACDGYAGL